MIKITRAKDGKGYSVHKDGALVAGIEFVAACIEWPDEDHWALKQITGRVDRHESLEAARSDALKI